MADLDLPQDHTAASRARRFVSATLRDWGYDDDVADAELLVSELVTNAVLHARSAARVSVERRNGSIRISVCDSSSALPRLREYGVEAVTGRGLLLVDRLAQRWGVEPNAAGKCVWFETGRATPSES